MIIPRINNDDPMGYLFIIVMIPWLGTATLKKQPRASQVITQLPSELQGDRALVLEAVMKNWKALKTKRPLRDRCVCVWSPRR